MSGVRALHNKVEDIPPVLTNGQTGTDSNKRAMVVKRMFINAVEVIRTNTSKEIFYNLVTDFYWVEKHEGFIMIS